MALKEFHILRCLAQRGREGRTALIQLDYSLESGNNEKANPVPAFAIGSKVGSL